MTNLEDAVAPEFQAWPKIARLNRRIVITEKIDGTNSAVICTEDGGVYAQSRKRLITPGKSTDNFGFAAWVQEHADELFAGLGPGYHYGEWYGSGIQRGYGLEQGEKRFALFNVGRWNVLDEGGCYVSSPDLPHCCEVVPTLYEGPFSQHDIDMCVEDLRVNGSLAVPRFMRPEGIVIWHTAARMLFKVTLEKDEKPKNSRE